MIDGVFHTPYNCLFQPDKNVWPPDLDSLPEMRLERTNDVSNLSSLSDIVGMRRDGQLDRAVQTFGQLVQGFGLDLAHAFAGKAQAFADFF
jgi:hypothetical protein